MPKLASKTEINSATGEITKTYRLDGQPCPTVLLDGHIARRVAGIAAILADLVDARQWVEEVHRILGPMTPRELGDLHFSSNELSLPMQVKPMWLAAVVTYMKCFTENEERKISMNYPDLDSKFHETHKLIQAVRNDYFAHAGKSSHERYHSYLILGPNREAGNFKISHHVARSDFSDDRNDNVPFLALIDEAIRVADKMGSKAKVRLEKEVLEQGLAYWYEKAAPLRM